MNIFTVIPLFVALCVHSPQLSFTIGLSGTIISAFGLLFSILAFTQARKAKTAARKAGKTVRIQTIAIDLNDLCQLLESIDESIKYSKARSIFNIINKKLKRLMEFIKSDTTFTDNIKKINETLDKFEAALKNAKPSNESKEPIDPQATFYFIDNIVNVLNGQIAELMGKCENRATISDKETI